MDLNTVSKYIALILRHKPETIGISIDKHGWANVNQLIKGINLKYPITMKDLETIVETDRKQRYAFNEDKTLIRANQGHSIKVDVELKETLPPKVLYHGSAKKYTASIEQYGLLPKTRLYVHLSSNVETAITVGSRHGKAVVYSVDAKSMVEDGYTFYLSVNNVWLIKEVPVKYLKRIK